MSGFVVTKEFLSCHVNIRFNAIVDSRKISAANAPERINRVNNNINVETIR